MGQLGRFGLGYEIASKHNHALLIWQEDYCRYTMTSFARGKFGRARNKWGEQFQTGFSHRLPMAEKRSLRERVEMDRCNSCGLPIDLQV